MKNNIFAGAVVALTLTGNMAHAGYKFPINYTGEVCIERSSFEINEVFSLVSKDSEDHLLSLCENSPGSSGAFSKIKSIAVKTLQHGCPFGHQFEYELVAECIIP